MQPEIIKIVNLIFLDAVQKRASDVHFEVYEEDFRVRAAYRRSLLVEIVSPPKHAATSPPLVARLKVLCSMDIGEKPPAAGRAYRAQGGRHHHRRPRGDPAHALR